MSSLKFLLIFTSNMDLLVLKDYMYKQLVLHQLIFSKIFVIFFSFRCLTDF